MSGSAAVLVIGGGPAGLRAAADLAQIGIPVALVEKREELGGAPIRWKYKTLAPELRPTEEVMAPMIGAVESHPLVSVYRASLVQRVSGRAGSFRVALQERRARAGAFRGGDHRGDRL